MDLATVKEFQMEDNHNFEELQADRNEAAKKMNSLIVEEGTKIHWKTVQTQY